MYSFDKQFVFFLSLPSGLIVISDFPLVLKSVYSFVARIEVEFKDIARKKAPINTPIFLKLKLLFFISKIKSIKNNSPIIIIK